jgi:hypothetical protein
VKQRGFSFGFDDGLKRALAPGVLGTMLLGSGLAAAAAMAEKKVGLLGAATRALEGQVFGLIVPLSLLWISTRIFDRRRLDDRATPLARFGQSRRWVALGLIAASMLVGALLSILAAVTAALLAHDPSAPAAAMDALTCAWIAALTAAAYVALLALGATFGARGGGRFWALAFDFLFGGTAGVAALLVPRGHAQNLLGGEPPLLLSQPASAIALVVLASAFTALAVARCRP